jgi:hypothetical protein
MKIQWGERGIERYARGVWDEKTHQAVLAARLQNEICNGQGHPVYVQSVADGVAVGATRRKRGKVAASGSYRQSRKQMAMKALNRIIIAMSEKLYPRAHRARVFLFPRLSALCPVRCASDREGGAA